MAIACGLLVHSSEGAHARRGTEASEGGAQADLATYDSTLVTWFDDLF